MTLYVFVLTVKYAKEYRVSETYKITNNLSSNTSRDRYTVTVITGNCAESRIYSAL